MATCNSCLSMEARTGTRAEVWRSWISRLRGNRRIYETRLCVLSAVATKVSEITGSGREIHRPAAMAFAGALCRLGEARHPVGARLARLSLRGQVRQKVCAARASA